MDLEKAKLIFSNAENFNKAKRILNERITKHNDTDVIFPSFVTKTFALELYFKCLYYLEYKRDAPRIHSLDQLYRKLKPDSKKQIKDNYDIYVSADPLFFQMKNTYPDMNLDIESALRNAKDAFANLRYIHDGKFSDVVGIAHIINATRMRIISVTPEITSK